MGLCPFPGHNEKTPSFSVSEGKQVYYCFGCKRSGNIYTFMQEMRGLSFPESVEELAHRAGIPIPAQDKSPAESRRHNQRQLFVRINNFAAEFFHRNLLQQTADSSVRKYMGRRGLSPELIKKFQLGVAPATWDSLCTAVQKRSIPIEAVAQVGLVKAKKDKSGFFDMFRDRLIFPIHSHTGDCIGFGGRSLNDEPPKYLNSPESEVFHKGKSLYGLHETAKFIRSSDAAVVVEGYMDFMALYRSGIKNVVAVLGTALTADHAHILKRFTKNVVVLFDGDSAGEQATERSLEVLLAAELYPRVVHLPAGQDPDDFIDKKGVEALELLLQSPMDLFTFLLQKNLKNFSGEPSEKVQVLGRMTPYLRSTKDERLRHLYMEQVADALGQNLRWVSSAVGQLKTAGTKLTQNGERDVSKQRGKITISNAPKAEIYLLNFVLSDVKWLNLLEESRVLEQFSSQEIAQILSRVMEAYRQKPNQFDKLTALLANEVEPPSRIAMHMETAWEEMDGEASQRLFSDCLKKVKEAFLRKEQRLLKEQMRAASREDRQRQLEQFMNIQKDRQALFKEQG